jgi:hypothetical protein
MGKIVCSLKIDTENGRKKVPAQSVEDEKFEFILFLISNAFIRKITAAKV